MNWAAGTLLPAALYYSGSLPARLPRPVARAARPRPRPAPEAAPPLPPLHPRRPRRPPRARGAQARPLPEGGEDRRGKEERRGEEGDRGGVGGAEGEPQLGGPGDRHPQGGHTGTGGWVAVLLVIHLTRRRHCEKCSVD